MRLIVYNPSGGSMLRGRRLRAALEVLRGLPGSHVLVATEPADMAMPIRRALDAHPSITEIVACGGDGTVGAAAAAVEGRAVPVGIVPTGTTNVLAFELGLPTDPVEAAMLFGRALRPVRFRTWSVNGRLMLLQLGVGFDGRLIWKTSRRMKRALGFAGVVASAVRHGVVFDYPRVRLTGEQVDGSTRSVVVTSALIANAKRWAGPQLTVPTADPADDLLDVLLLQYGNFGELAAFWLAILFPDARHLRLRYVEHVQMRRLRIEAQGRPVEAHRDGEPDTMTPIAVEPRGHVTLLAAS